MTRPRVVFALLLLIFGQGAMFLTDFALYAFNAAQYPELLTIDPGGKLQAGMSLYLLSSTWLVLGLASIIVGVGLRRGRPWAWTAALILEGAILVLALEAYATREADALFSAAMGWAAVVGLLLNHREVQAFYRTDLRAPFDAEGSSDPG